MSESQQSVNQLYLKKMYIKQRFMKLIIIIVYLMSVFSTFQCQDVYKPINTQSLEKSIEHKVLDQQKKSEENLKTLSRSKASVWVDTNKGNIFSTSIGSSHLERDKSGNGTNRSEPVGRSSNMLLTLMIQPGSQTPVTEMRANDGHESSLKPILLLLQQQQDLSELLLEKQEKVEKMNVHLQQQVKHQHLLMVELLEQIKMFLEVINAPNFSSNNRTVGVSSESLNRLSHRFNPLSDAGTTSATSSANAVVTAPKTKGPDNNAPISTAAPPVPRKLAPILANSNAETVGIYRKPY